MQIFAVTLAIVTSVLHHYVFSFQRFTLTIARRHAQSTRDVGELQILMTPTRMGVMGGLVPLFRFTHFSTLVRSELSRSMVGPNGPLAARLMIDVIRSEGSGPTEPTAV